MSAAVYAGILALGGIALVPDPTTHVPGWYGLFMAFPVYGIAAILLIPIVRNRTQGQLQVLALAIVRKGGGFCDKSEPIHRQAGRPKQPEAPA